MRATVHASPLLVNRPRVAGVVALLFTVIALTALLRPDQARPEVELLPSGIVTNPATGAVYVTNMGADTVAVLDGASGRVVATVPVGPAPVGIDVNPRTNRVYVASWRGGAVAVIDGETNRVVDRVAVGAYPWAVQVDPLTNQIYVANRGSRSVSVLDGETHRVRFTLRAGREPASLALLSDLQLLFVSNRGDGTVTVFNTARRAPVRTIPVGGYVWGLVADPAARQVYVALMGEARVTRIDASISPPTIATEQDRPGPLSGAAPGANLISYPTGLDPAALAFDPPTGRVYVTNRRSGSVTVIDAARERMLRPIDVGRDPFAVAVDSERQRVYVANRASGTVSIIDAKTARVLATVSVSSVGPPP